MLFSTEFLFGLLLRFHFEELGAGWGSVGESMLPVLGRPFESQSRHAVIGTRDRRNR